MVREGDRRRVTNLSWGRPRVDDGWHTTLSPVRRMVVVVVVAMMMAMVMAMVMGYRHL